MKVQLENVLPGEIEKRSMQIIEAECTERGITLDPETSPVVKRVIHTSADFDYAENLVFSNGAMQAGLDALRSGAHIFTDTKMAWSGINKTATGKLGCEAHCFISDEDVAKAAKENGTTRAVASMDKAAGMTDHAIFAIGNAPTALIRLYELIEDGLLHPSLVIGVPVGFVNVVESKELILSTDVPAIVARGRKGGSNVAACIVNALSYIATGRTL
ncbi:MAG: precorrin-8X methylmutase [Coriobacteriales bacterium]